MLQGANVVALYAILLREAGNNHHTGPDSVFDESCSCPGEISFASLLALQSFTDLDWNITEMLADHPERSLRVAKNFYEYEEPLVAEALLHARTRQGREPKAKWTEPFQGNRWREVRRAIHSFEREGIATNFDEINRVADDAYCAGTGASREELLAKFYDPQWDEEARASVA